MSAGQGRSAPYTLAIVLVMAFVTGALILTAVDPVVQGLFGSQIWSANTAEGQNLLGWLESLWQFWPAALLLGFALIAWIKTRQPT